jgi:hypothetical protein
LLPFKNEERISLFSSLLNRELLKESEISITKKHSRETEKEFSIFGIVTQLNSKSDKINILNEKNAQENSSIKESLMNMISLFTDVERTFHGKLENEFVIDPIAVYREL